MSQPCYECGGDGNCTLCHGTGSMKEIVTHPDPWDVDDNGEVTCSNCGGDGNCTVCGGDGTEEDD